MRFPWTEHFDSLASLPGGWTAGGFVLSTSTPRTPPHCLSATGNTSEKEVWSVPIDLRQRVPVLLTFWERRSPTAAAYRLEVSAQSDSASKVLALFDAISTLSTYVERTVTVDGYGFEDRPNVRFRWRILADNTNGTGILRLDDVELTAAAWNDLALTRIAFQPPAPDRQDPIACTLTIRNAGRVAALNGTASVFTATDRAELFRREPLRSIAYGAVAAGDSLAMEILLPPLDPGVTWIGGRTDSPGDEENSNDTLSSSLTVGAVTRDVVINEIMFAPAEGSAEWVELLNASPVTIDLTGWTICDAPTPSGTVNRYALSGHLQPGMFSLLASDSSVFRSFPSLTGAPHCRTIVANRTAGLGLTNDGDAIVLRDAIGTVVDTLRYSPAWHFPDLVETAGRSLERVNPLLPSMDPRNWSTCTDPSGGTPGKRNSIALSEPVSDGTLSIAPNPFSPDGDGFEDRTMIRFTLPCPTAVLNIRIYDLRGRLVRWLCNSEVVGPSGAIVWDGTDDRRERLPIGPYVLLFQASNTIHRTEVERKALIVVARRL